ncbi:hypothetical protein Sked_13600 [Sanguibacter keddieii DSM 10542]|uniref:Uncharacterized protein n=1 Tax=Sanguibacter keddieii (strain ATCC 51767 / DSM 10542 / NCFB 3025 / ST-74) TaxID=446469 RepID=D1BF04_SANKS|nr:hypothetical protein [Sanguibacter keddieii]ACZ21300.1 hypothetical protein Sked_13600 [Sanguibacter keddieii DSM 10542]
MHLHHRTAQARAAAPLLALVVALSACSGAQSAPPETGSGEIASIPTTEAPAAPGPADPTQGGPPADAADAAGDDLFATYGEPVRLRLDMTEEEEIEAQAGYDRCTMDHSGIPAGAGSDAGGTEGGTGPASPEQAAADREATEHCASLLPLAPWEYDPQNPDALNFVQAVVDCLHDRGVTYVEVVQDDGRIGVALGGPSNDSRSISLGMELHDQCETSVVDAGSWQ